MPLGPALTAAVDCLDMAKTRAGEKDEANAAFSEWINAERDDLSTRPSTGWFARRSSVLHLASVDVEVARTLAEDAPDTPSGRAWKEAVLACVALTEADVHRPYDDCWYDTETEAAAEQAVSEFAELLRETSPLLESVADTVENLTLGNNDTLGDIMEARARLTAEGLVVGNKSECDKHEEDCYGDDRALAAWDHINLISPGAEDRLRGLLADLDAGMPPVIGDDDNGKGRIPAQYRRH